MNVELIRESFQAVVPIADQVVDYFYERLLALEVGGLFKGVDMPRQKKSLLAALAFIVNNLTETETLVQYLKAMGQRHVKYGVEERHYPVVGATLIDTFEHFFKEQWTPALEAAWRDAVMVIAQTMIDGARAQMPKTKTPDLDLFVQGLAQKVLERALTQEASKGFIEAARTTARELLYEALLTEADQIFAKGKAAS